MNPQLPTAKTFAPKEQHKNLFANVGKIFKLGKQFSLPSLYLTRISLSA
jgi:hypothetical protein